MIINQIHKEFAAAFEVEKFASVESIYSLTLDDMSVAFPKLDEFIKKYQDPKEVDKIVKLKENLKEVENIVHKNLDDVC